MGIMPKRSIVNQLKLYTIAMNRACVVDRYDKYLRRNYCSCEAAICNICDYNSGVDDAGWPDCYMQSLVNKITDLKYEQNSWISITA